MFTTLEFSARTFKENLEKCAKDMGEVISLFTNKAIGEEEFLRRWTQVHEYNIYITKRARAFIARQVDYKDRKGKTRV